MKGIGENYHKSLLDIRTVSSSRCFALCHWHTYIHKHTHRCAFVCLRELFFFIYIHGWSWIKCLQLARWNVRMIIWLSLICIIWNPRHTKNYSHKFIVSDFIPQYSVFSFESCVTYCEFGTVHSPVSCSPNQSCPINKGEKWQKYDFKKTVLWKTTKTL